MPSIHIILLIISVILAIVAAFPVSSRVGLLPLAVAFLAASFLVP